MQFYASHNTTVYYYLQIISSIVVPLDIKDGVVNFKKVQYYVGAFFFIVNCHSCTHFDVYRTMTTDNKLYNILTPLRSMLLSDPSFKAESCLL